MYCAGEVRGAYDEGREGELEEICVTGEEFGAGRRSCDEKVAQYFWSVVNGDGAAGKRTGWSDVTSAAIAEGIRGVGLGCRNL
jgi:hypothetical protein